MALRLLAEAGVGATFEAADGVAALEMLRQLPQPPDTLLVDLDMPGTDGVELIGHVAQHRKPRATALLRTLDTAVLNHVHTVPLTHSQRVPRRLQKPHPSSQLPPPP